MSKKNDKKRIEEKTKTTSKQYNRIFLLRYFLVVLFFVNLYWFLSLILSQSWVAIIPIVLLVFSGIAYVEQLRFANNPKDDYIMKKNKLFFSIQSFTIVVLLLALFNRISFNILFPFLVFNQQLILGLGVLFIIGIILSLVCQKKINDISNNKA